MATAGVKDSRMSSSKGKEKAGKAEGMGDKRTAASANNDTQAVEFNLSDPDQLARQLDRVDLTEQESDELLREAYKVNKHLRMMLKQKQESDAASMRSQSATSNASSASSIVSPKSGVGVLPPINKKGGSAVPQRSVRAYSYGSGTSAVSKAGSKSQSKTGKSRAVPQRPSWDDRFSHS